MPEFNNYDPGLVVLTFGEVIFQGFQSGTMITAMREADTFSMSTGAVGDTTRVKSRNKNGTVTANLQNEASINDLLSSIWRSDELFGQGVRPLMLKYVNGTTIYQAPFAWIRKMPDLEYSDSANGVEWILDCNRLTPHIGGTLT